MPRYVVISNEGDDAYGPFTSGHTANKFAEALETAEVAPGCAATVIELIPVREGLKIIRECEDMNAER
jgi:hypothetical protein